MSDRERLAAYFRREVDGIYFEEIEEQHRRMGLDPMTCNDSTCRRAVARADALLASDALAGMLTEARTEAWDDGYDAGHEDARAVQRTYPDLTRNPYRAALTTEDAP